MSDHVLNAYDTFKPGDKVRVKYDDLNIAPASREGTIVDMLSSGHVSVEIDGQYRMYSFEQLEKIPNEAAVAAVSSAPVLEFKLLRTITAPKLLNEEDDGIEISTDPFENEIQKVFAQKVVRITNDLINLRRAWDETVAQQLGANLTKFIQHMAPQLDHLVTLVGVAEDDSALKHARSKFEELLELTSEVANQSGIRAWAELQDEALDQIFQ